MRDLLNEIAFGIVGSIADRIASRVRRARKAEEQANFERQLKAIAAQAARLEKAAEDHRKRLDDAGL